MQFKIHVPRFIETGAPPEWCDVDTLEDCLEKLFPGGPYRVFLQDAHEEKVVDVSMGSEYFVETRCGKPHLLMEYRPDGGYYVLGYLKDDDLPEATAKWNEDRGRWDTTPSIPESRY